MVDFYLRKPLVNEERIETNFLQTMHKLSKFFGLPEESEMDQINLLIKLEEKLRPAKFKKLNEYLFLSKPVTTEISNSLCNSIIKHCFCHMFQSIAKY